MRPHYNHSLTRSTTRITVLEYCNKKYYFNYYPHSLKSIDEKLRLDTLLLKNLKSIDMWIGEKTHHLLSDYLNALKRGSLDAAAIQDIKDRVIQEMRDEFTISKNRDYNSYDKDNKFGLSEHYYGEDLGDDADDKLEKAIQKVVHNLDVFLQSDRNETVQHYFNTAKKVFVEKPRQKDFESMKLNLSTIPELRNLNVMAAPDFGVVFSDTAYLIIDRKSGQEKIDIDGVSEQLKIYALKTILKSGTDINALNIEAYEVYLPSLNKIGGKITKVDIDNIIQKLKDDMEYQKQFLVDGDIVQNEPLPHENFPRTTNAKKCASCTFRKVCGELKNFE